jgi:hypothetical protein
MNHTDGIHSFASVSRLSRTYLDSTIILLRQRAPGKQKERDLTMMMQRIFKKQGLDGLQS